MHAQQLTLGPKLELVAERPHRERRTDPRTTPLHTHCLTLTTGDRFLVALLVDHNMNGLGVQTFEPLSAGAVVFISGTVKVGDVWMAVKGSASVVHSRAAQDESFFLGLDFVEVDWCETDDPRPAAGFWAA